MKNEQKLILWITLLCAILTSNTRAQSSLSGSLYQIQFLNAPKLVRSFDSTMALKKEYKSCLTLDYYDYDSTKPEQKISSTLKEVCNSKGYLQYTTKTDTTGLIDSNYIQYNENNEAVELGDFDKHIGIKTKMKLSYDKGTIASVETIQKHKSYFYTNKHTGKDSLTTSIIDMYFNYDKNGNITKTKFTTTATGPEDTTRDTSVFNYKYYAKDRVASADMNIIKNGNKSRHQIAYDYDEQNRLVSITDMKDSDLIQHVSYNYKSNKGWVETTVKYTYPSNSVTSCNVGTSTQIKEYDKDTNLLRNRTIKTKNSDTTTETTEYRRTFVNGRVIIDSIFNEITGQMEHEKKQKVITYKYDANGNKTERQENGASAYANNSTEKWEFNSHNKVIKQLGYEDCTDKPNSTTINEYYEDGITLKQKSTTSLYDNEIVKYDRKGNKIFSAAIRDGRYIDVTANKYNY